MIEGIATIVDGRYSFTSTKGGANSMKDTNKKWAFLFIAANLVLFLIFFAWPAILGVYYSLTEYNGNVATFIGLDNYINLFQDSSFYKALSRTFIYTALGVPLVYVTSLFVSVMLTSKHTKGKNVAKIIFFFPWLVSPIVVGGALEMDVWGGELWFC
ncbi:sugar ABC transporter permease [Gracilibacillus sp. JCM 18860]|uniref:carbohydrate ABC transporter permease n=1 Tax=Gracilibacillus sp. JCM 18860 TaxID=1306159 RepID=UPI000B13B8CF